MAREGKGTVMTGKNAQFEIGGVNHVALVCSDMARTVDFYTNVLGMPLVKTIELPDGTGQHFFFDIGNGDTLAFFWFPNAPEAVPGVASASALPGRGDLDTAIGSMNHLAFGVPAEKMEEYREKLKAKGITCTGIANHDDSPSQVSREMHDGVFLRSLYFFDPDGILLEFAAWTRELTDDDVDGRLLDSNASHSAVSG
jgi:catechol 2,3-dioxygenase-like lactoylglutathione lyase family enzyme